MEHIQKTWILEDGGEFENVPYKTSIDSFYGTAGTTLVRNYFKNKGKYKLVFLIRGEIHDLLAAEVPTGVAVDPYDLMEAIDDFLATKQVLASSMPIHFNYPHYHGVGVHREFEGLVTKFVVDDDAGIGSGLDYPSWPYYMEFTVGKVVNGAT